MGADATALEHFQVLRVGLFAVLSRFAKLFALFYIFLYILL